VIAGVLVGSALWRAATYRYVRERRRRQQSLLVRRVVVGVALGLVVAFAFVSVLGSIATFAGSSCRARTPTCASPRPGSS
jgi:hypothetical protein